MSDNPFDNPNDPANTGWTAVPEPNPATAPEDTAPRVGFCQDCGKPLTAQTVRTVGSGVFCESCLAARINATAAGSTTVPPTGAGPIPPPPPPVPPVNTSPALAAFLGLIPGVGAMYNGQFAKAVAHLAIFVLLKLLEDSVSSAFGLLVVGWVFYQVFDAYHTAKARAEGLPLPNPFGLNDIGERMGFGRNWPNAGSANTAWGAARPTSSTWQSTPPPTPPAAPVPPVSGPDWVGYVPPTHFASYTPPPPVSPYTPPGHGTPYTPVAPVPVPPQDVVTPTNQLPVGALWLIGLGALILVANMLPRWGMSERWWPPILFAGLAVFVLQRRLRRSSNLFYALRAPAILLILAFFGALHAAEIHFNPGLFVAVLFIVIGLLLLVERTMATPYIAAAPPAPRASFIPAAEPPPASTPVPPAEGPSEGETR